LQQFGDSIDNACSVLRTAIIAPFAGAAPAVQSVLAGHTPVAFTVLTPAVPQVREEKTLLV
jgi:tripartite-type tricarboxylate transporter receptor subunit TctC